MCLAKSTSEGPGERFLRIESAIERQIHDPHAGFDQNPPHRAFQTASSRTSHHDFGLKLIGPGISEPNLV
jgi:hypothetical protein